MGVPEHVRRAAMRITRFRSRVRQIDDPLTVSLNELAMSFGLDWPLPAFPNPAAGSGPDVCCPA